MSRVQLASIRSLMFYKGSETLSRRNQPVPQMSCIGYPCKRYTPEVVRCENIGGVGTEVDWRCEADLPEALRFGRVEVSCEGWDGPGDPYVLKGSCALNYRLVQTPAGLRSEDSHAYIPHLNWNKALEIAFMVLWVGFLVLILYSFLKSCLRGNQRQGAAPRPPSPRPDGSGGWFPGYHPDNSSPPPPYSKNYPNAANEPWRPGFWTGAALAGLGTHLLNNRRQTNNAEPRATTWDWERTQRAVPVFGGTSPSARSDDRGEGSSNLGAMRRSTGLGGSNVR